MSASRQVLLGGEPPRTLQLNQQLGRGGQAVVYVSETDPELAVKLYYQPAANVERRLEGMLRLAHADDFLTDDAAAHPELAWPIAMVRDIDDKRVIGYAMRRVGTPEFFPLGVLFNRRQRQKAVAQISWRFFVGVSRNLTGLVATLHERGLVLGDVSHANVVVSRKGYLTFIDCDSMQFVAPSSGEHFPCLVLTAEYAAPELQRNGHLERTPESDCFSLALLVCRMLLVGDHPFMGIRSSAPPDDESGTTDNIRDGYSYLVRPEEMDIPPTAFDPGLLPPAILQLARRTFGEGLTDPGLRPAAAEWLDALDDTRQALAVCSEHRIHVYSEHLAACPWCARSSNGLSDPFLWKGPPVQDDSSNAGAALAAAIVLVVVIVLLLLLL